MPASLAFGKPTESLDLVLVHDNRGAQGILRSMISSMRLARLRVYEHAEKALGEMVMDPPTALMCDWHMRPVSGHRFVRMLRDSSMEPLCYLPILAVTPMPTLSLVDRAFSVGVNNILVLPISPSSLRRRLEWLRSDDREFVLEGDRYVLDGMNEVLEERVRRSDVTSLLHRHRAMQQALARRTGSAQDIVDGIAGGVDGDGAAVSPAAAGAGGDAKLNWNSWNVAGS